MKTSHRNAPPGAKKKFSVFGFITVLLAVAVGIELVIGIVGVTAVRSMLDGEPEMNVDDFLSQENSIIYDKDGNEIANVGTQMRENITYDQVPEAMIDAFLSIEDSRYFNHNGFDIPRFTASMINTVLQGNVQGGSTFTMQLVKLTYFQNDADGTSRTKDVEYKIQQIDLALQLEKQLDKKKIFEMYLNKMNFGGVGNIRGVQKASEQYFGKSVSELNLPECALLAGVVNAPYAYDPHNYLDQATERRNQVLDMMAYHGYISEDACTLAKSVRVEDELVDPASTSSGGTYQYQAYIDEVLKEAASVTGLDPMSVSMEIHTAMNPTVQQKYEEIEAGNADNIEWFDNLEMGGVTMNNKTGEIIAIGGGRNYASGGSMLLNHATEQYKQPGSTVKPFLDYAPAIEYLGWNTGHQITDYPFTYGGFEFSNAADQQYGEQSITRALVYSLNVPALKTCMKVIDEKGTDWYIQYMKDLGFDDNIAEMFNYTFAIGGNDFTTTPEQLAGAHSVIMNGGYYIKPHTITSIHYRVSNKPDYTADYQKSQVMSEQTAWIISYMMHEVIVEQAGWGDTAILARNYQTFAKTGTTDWGTDGLQYGIPQGSSKDKWLVGEDTMYTTALWVGYEKASSDYLSYWTSGMENYNLPGRIVSAIIDASHADGSVPEDYAMPSGVSQVTTVKGIFPYVAPPEGMSSDLTVTGYIKSEYADLGSFSAAVPSLSSLNSFSASEGDNQAVSFRWTAYPGGTDIASKFTIDRESIDAEQNLFNIGSYTGNVVYKVRLSQNGSTIGEYTSPSETLTETVSGLVPGQAVQACGYYAYSNLESNVSNEVCSTFTAKEEKREEPEILPTERPEVSPSPSSEPVPSPSSEPAE